MNNKKLIKKAYSLLELSIVIVIISILIAGALSVSTSGIHNAKVKITQDRMKEIYKAMGNFLIANRRLPCPAPITAIKNTTTTYGTEAENGVGICDGSAGVFKSTVNGDLFYGMVPTRTLDLPNEMAEDGFGSKIVYIIDRRFADAASPDATLINIPSDEFSTAVHTAILTIHEKPSGILQTVTSNAIMALISHGVNKAGAFNSNSASYNTRSSDSDENNNDLGPDIEVDAVSVPSTANFNSTLVATSSNSDVFDDIVLFKTRNDFVADFNAMFLIPCDGLDTSTTNFTNGSDNAYYGQIVTNGDCTPPDVQMRKCEAYGAWVNVSDSCL